MTPVSSFEHLPVTAVSGMTILVMCFSCGLLKCTDNQCFIVDRLHHVCPIQNHELLQASRYDSETPITCFQTVGSVHAGHVVLVDRLPHLRMLKIKPCLTRTQDARLPSQDA